MTVLQWSAFLFLASFPRVVNEDISMIALCREFDAKMCDASGNEDAERDVSPADVQTAVDLHELDTRTHQMLSTFF